MTLSTSLASECEGLAGCRGFTTFTVYEWSKFGFTSGDVRKFAVCFHTSVSRPLQLMNDMTRPCSGFYAKGGHNLTSIRAVLYCCGFLRTWTGSCVMRLLTAG